MARPPLVPILSGSAQASSRSPAGGPEHTGAVRHHLIVRETPIKPGERRSHPPQHGSKATVKSPSGARRPARLEHGAATGGAKPQGHQRSSLAVAHNLTLLGGSTVSSPRVYTNMCACSQSVRAKAMRTAHLHRHAGTLHRDKKQQGLLLRAGERS